MGCSLVDPVSWASCPGDLFKSVAGDAFGAVARDFGEAADSAINWLWAQIGSATEVSLSGPGFETDLAIVGTITGVVAVGLFVLQVGRSALRRDPGGLARALKGLLVAFVGGGLAIGTVTLLLKATDDLSAGVVQLATGGSVQQMGESLLAAGVVSAASNNPAVIIVLAVATLAAVVLVWGALMVRKALIVVTAVFAPLAFAGSLADITVGWTRRWMETTLALVASKLLLVLVFMVGLGLFDGVGQASSGVGQNITQVVTGLLVLALAGFTPWVALKLVHFVGDEAHHLHLLASTSTSGTSRAYSAARKAGAWAAPQLRAAPSAGGPRPPGNAQFGPNDKVGGTASAPAALVDGKDGGGTPPAPATAGAARNGRPAPADRPTETSGPPGRGRA